MKDSVVWIPASVVSAPVGSFLTRGEMSGSTRTII